jgi:DNA-binding CsgD family transcriptional regulator
MKPKWSDIEKITLHRLVAQGTSWPEIARIMGRSADSVAKMARVLGFARRRAKIRRANAKAAARRRVGLIFSGNWPS